MVFFQAVFVSIGIQPMSASICLKWLVPQMLILQMFFPAFFIINFDNWSFVSGFIMPDRTGQHSDHIRSHANEILSDECKSVRHVKV